MDQWTKWVRVKSCGKEEYNTSSSIVKVSQYEDGYSYAVVTSAEARDLGIRHKFEVCAPPKAPIESSQEEKKESKPKVRKGAAKRKKADK